MTSSREKGGRGFMPSHQTASPQPQMLSNADLILNMLCRARESDRRKFLRKQSLPDYLYKFKRVDLQKPKYLEDIIVNSTLFLSSPSSFNDPFDMKPRAIVEGDLTTLLKKIESLPCPSEKAKRDALREAQMAWQEQGSHGVFIKYKVEDIVESLFADTGVFCFSTVHRQMSRETGPRNKLMWSHYGDSHAGICLQFQVSKDPAILRRLVRVSYSDEYPTINWLSTRMEEECLSAATNKEPCWSYEHEWRYVQLNSANTKLSFDPSLLTGIFLGARLSEVSMAEVTRLLKARQKASLPEVRLYRVQADRSSYKIRVIQCTQ